MVKLARKSMILAKSEATYGTDVNPDASDAVLIANLSVTPVELRTVDRDFLRAHLGASAQLVVGQSARVEFDVELAGSGAAAIPPAYGHLLKACGLGETVVLNQKVRYQPLSADFGSLSIHFYADGTRQAVTGARGNVSLSLSPGAIPTMSFAFTGQYNKATEADNPSASLAKYKTPVPVNKATATLTLDGLAVVAHEFTVDLGNQVTHQDVIGADQVLITDRQVTGNMVINLPASDSKDFVDMARQGNLVALAFTVGATVGAKVAVKAAQVQVTDPTLGDADGVRTLSLGLRLVPSAGNDEVTLETA